ncbi:MULTISPECIES: DUF3306 domain-containing protein [unclassified Halomonas]|uniref:DUF3306 domain-containing protein n=1 Tax=unclassified Halomonas TaxID=2609666 RepID=UPI0009904886|nr:MULTISPECIES: DUF3306 domain-containing protein [unclassified Halomonas]AQU83751.1 hypothetical protein B2G49_14915 [Halomonas sp. 'Soap Lake \
MSRLERWSRKKRGVEDEPALVSEEPAPLAELISTEAEARDGTVESGLPSEPQLQVGEQAEQEAPAPGSLDHTLPDPDTLPPGSDFSVFMASGVSAALRRRALKRLWATGNYNVRDGLDDYDADYRQQLKPMASELAGKLRRWANKEEERSGVNEEGSVAEGGTESSADTSTHSSAHTSTSGDRRVQDLQLDDQSDSIDEDVDECTKIK